MSDLIDGLRLGFEVFTWLVSMAMMVFYFRLVGAFFRQLAGSINPTLNRDPRTMKISLRRLICNHRHVSRVRNSYGLNYTACTHCVKDVNAGKRTQEWR